MDRIIDGVRRFARITADEGRDFYAKLAKGQAPRALFVTCSDSRVVPSLLTGTQAGELFILRNAGNVVPPFHGLTVTGEAATVEYAVRVLQLKHIIVCGHSNCGAMKALLTPDTVSHLSSIRAWLSLIEPVREVVESMNPDASKEHLCELATEANVLQQMINLRTHPAVAAAHARRELRIHGWVYDIAEGTVRAYDAQTEQFVLLGKHERRVLSPLSESPTERDADAQSEGAV